jgi:hypothetical protein
MNLRKQLHIKIGSLLLAACLLSLSACKSFPVVETRVITSITPRVPGAALHICASVNPDGTFTRLNESECTEIHSCMKCDQDGQCLTLPMDECDATIGYSIKDHQRIMEWGRTHCN